jgi:hypothetical protein
MELFHNRGIPSPAVQIFRFQIPKPRLQATKPPRMIGTAKAALLACSHVCPLWLLGRGRVKARPLPEWRSPGPGLLKPVVGNRESSHPLYMLMRV